MDLEERIIRESIAACASEDDVALVRAHWDRLWHALEVQHPFRLILADAIEKRREKWRDS